MKYESKVTAPTVKPQRDGYTFEWWDKEIPTTMPAENIVITAKWTPIEYTVTFDKNGSGDEIEDLTYTIESWIDSLPTSVWTGYVFSGWYDEENKQVTEIETWSYWAVNLKAEWKAAVVNYTVTHYREAWEWFNKNGKTASQALDGKWYYKYTSDSFTGLVGEENKTSNSKWVRWIWIRWISTTKCNIRNLLTTKE